MLHVQYAAYMLYSSIRILGVVLREHHHWDTALECSLITALYNLNRSQL